MSMRRTALALSLCLPLWTLSAVAQEASDGSASSEPADAVQPSARPTPQSTLSPRPGSELSPELNPEVKPPEKPPAVFPDPQKRPFFLTLTGAIDEALRTHVDVKKADSQLRDAQLRITETGAQGLPQLTATASYARQDPVISFQTTDTTSSPGAGAGTNPQFAAFLGTASVNTFQSNITLSQVLFAGFRIVDGVRIANINTELVEQAGRQTYQNLAFQVTNAYFSGLRALQVLELDRSTLKQAQEQMRMAEARVRAGVGVKLDVLQAQSQVIQIQQQLSRDLSAYKKAKMQINQWVGRPIDQPLELNQYAVVVKQQWDPEAAVREALEKRSDIRQLALQKEINDLNAIVAGRTTWPTVTAQVRYSLQDNAVVNGNTANNQNINYSLNMNWPIFDGLAAQSSSQRAKESALQSQLSLDQLKQQVILDVRQIYLDIEEAQERELMAKAGLQVAQENLRVAVRSYEAGVGIMMDVLQAQQTLRQAHNNLINVRYDLNIRRAQLYQILGLDLVNHLE